MTRVIRLIAEDTIESRVLALQRHKLKQGQLPAETQAQEIDQGVLLSFFDETKPLKQ